ncbi:hypothetical protein H4J58_02290 [Colwellia sp. MB3u-70]|uniref:hypothetical protein n=1 Tax=unclassified Colwellia TaxID=196834 RepID=UPI0015F54D0A|nr:MULTISPECIES: hypothetical protein [unclassified Colwellia]MBA6291591.1 hypothetical protein [Colwellia sp. MB3u-8]MBA6305965.1 hypothetical protein [Colwellia sp. MB3u-70]
MHKVLGRLSLLLIVIAYVFGYFEHQNIINASLPIEKLFEQRYLLELKVGVFLIIPCSYWSYHWFMTFKNWPSDQTTTLFGKTIAYGNSLTLRLLLGSFAIFGIFGPCLLSFYMASIFKSFI